MTPPARSPLAAGAARDPRLGELERVLRGAGELALGFFGRAVAERKPDRSFVTEADRAVERFLLRGLEPLEPGARFLGEEGTRPAPPSRGEPTWAIDPIDGTAVFVCGLATWSISVGLVRDGVPELGGVYLPVAGEMFLAGREGPLVWNGRELRRGDGPGAYREGLDAECWIGLPSNLHRRYRVRFPGKVRALGSTAAHLAWVARGAAVGAACGARLWDVAGGLACCRASGMAWSYLSGAAVDLTALLEGARTPEPLVAAHPDDLDEIRASIELLPLPAARPARG